MSAFEGSALQAQLAAQAQAQQQLAAENNGVGPKPVKELKLEEGDILRLENQFLKIENIKKASDGLQKDALILSLKMKEEQGTLEALRDRLSGKYGIDFTKARIMPDGTIIPNAATAPTNADKNPIAQALGKS